MRHQGEEQMDSAASTETINRLARISLRGYKTIRALDEFPLGPLNVLIGANGAGKSNFISFFRLLNWMVTSGDLQFFIGKHGGANALLHDGASVTPQIEACLEFETPKGLNDYAFRLFHAAPDTLIFAEERFRYSGNHLVSKAEWHQLGAGHREARLLEVAEQGNKTAQFIRRLLRQCVVYQFHNTSETARIRQRWDSEDNRYLKEDGANLGPFLRRLSQTAPKAYARIVEAIRQVAPFFREFVLDPVNGSVLLQWRERGTDTVFGSHQASDGTLRAMALIALLLQPIEDVPAVVILDEPELGLHPMAISIVAGLLKSLSLHRQIILATQSMTLIDYFDPEDIVVVDRFDRISQLKRLEPARLEEWLEEYSLAELWEKNVLGGRPGR
jgi:predicted ATPase